MSEGTVCLTCRKGITDEEWGCVCESPVPSDDGKTPRKEYPEPPKVSATFRFNAGRPRNTLTQAVLDAIAGERRR